MCTGTDGVRTAMCTFGVTLVPPQPVVSVQRFLAFGDSITAGENGEAAPSVIDQEHSYSWLLSGLLAARYTTQSPLVTDCGVPGEHVPMGASRIDAVLDQKKPDVLMLLEGVNDLSGDLSADRDAIISGLAYDIGAANRRGLAAVFLSTLLPQNPAGFRAHDIGELLPVNDSIRALAAKFGAVLVDNYAAMAGHPEYLATDGLHPTAAGSQVIAEQFFAGIRARFETLQPTMAGGGTGLAVPVDPNGCFDVPSVTTTRGARRIR
jgi:lysophospholipase L1-like esterase